jgi:hypothetical protein
VLWKLWVTPVCEPQAGLAVWDSRAATSRRDSNALAAARQPPRRSGKVGPTGEVAKPRVHDDSVKAGAGREAPAAWTPAAFWGEAAVAPALTSLLEGYKTESRSAHQPLDRHQAAALRPLGFELAESGDRSGRRPRTGFQF